MAGPAGGISFPTEAAPSSNATFVVRVTNTGERMGDTVIQAYFVPMSKPSQPGSRLLRQLFSYQRVHLAPGATAEAIFGVSSATLRLVDKANGDIISAPGEYALVFTDGAGAGAPRVNVTMHGDEVVVTRFPGGPGPG